MRFKRHDISTSTHVKGEKNIVSLPPELYTGLNAHICTHTNMDMFLSFQHQSSDMFNSMSLYVMDLWHVLLFMLLVMFSPAHLYCKSLPSPQKNRHTALISGRTLLYDTSRHVESCPFWLLFLLHIFKGCDVTSFGFGQEQSIWC